MKIFSNFDTELKKNEYEEAMKTYGKDRVLLVQRYMAFWIIRGIIPFCLVVIVNIAWFLLVSMLGNIKILPTILIWLIIIGDIIYLYKLFNLYLDYKFDYTLVTPNGIVTYKQKGLFNSKMKNLPTSKIRSTQSYRSGIISNIFSYGIIEILTDGGLGEENDDGSSQAGKTKLSYVHHPGKILKSILQITKVSSKNDED